MCIFILTLFSTGEPELVSIPIEWWGAHFKSFEFFTYASIISRVVERHVAPTTAKNIMKSSGQLSFDNGHCTSANVCRQVYENSIRDARTPQPREIVFNTMRHRRSETVQRSGNFHSKQCQLCKGSNNVSREKKFKRKKCL